MVVLASNMQIAAWNKLGLRLLSLWGKPCFAIQNAYLPPPQRWRRWKPFLAQERVWPVLGKHGGWKIVQIVLKFIAEKIIGLDGVFSIAVFCWKAIMLNLFLGPGTPEALFVGTDVVLGLVSRGWPQKWLAFLGQGSGVKASAPTDVSYFFELIFTFSGAKYARRGYFRTGQGSYRAGSGMWVLWHVMWWKKRCRIRWTAFHSKGGVR